MATAKSIVRILRQPILPESRALLAESWASLPDQFRTREQMFGRQGNCCGATIGAMPRCDFACRGCYLGEEANHVPAEPVDAIKDQMRRLRTILGNNGNLQLTDGEVTLRPEEEIVELLRYADEVGLIPMLMTHGDTFRRKPGLLERLVEGGLREVSIHVDTTMRGRTGAAYKHATREEELNPLREEFAQMVRDARRKTGLPLRCATTMTITRDNLGGVADAVRCVVANADAFTMLSFQPIAQVGRTEEGLGGGVSVEELWSEIPRGLRGYVSEREALLRGEMWLGHQACNRYVHGFVVKGLGRAPTFHPLWLKGEESSEKAIDGYLSRFGGVSYRRDSPPERVARTLALVMRAPRFWATQVILYFAGLLRRMEPARPAALALDFVRGRARADHFNLISHHFMSAEDLATPLGQERLAHCVFKLPVGDRFVSMCEVNALGVRDRYYEQIKVGRRVPLPMTPSGPAPPPTPRPS